MNAIRWIGGQRWLPRVGLVSPGHKLDIPAQIGLVDAESLVRQGLAEAYQPQGAPRREKE